MKHKAHLGDLYDCTGGSGDPLTSPLVDAVALYGSAAATPAQRGSSKLLPFALTPAPGATPAATPAGAKRGSARRSEGATPATAAREPGSALRRASGGGRGARGWMDALDAAAVGTCPPRGCFFSVRGCVLRQPHPPLSPADASTALLLRRACRDAQACRRASGGQLRAAVARGGAHAVSSGCAGGGCPCAVTAQCSQAATPRRARGCGGHARCGALAAAGAAVACGRQPRDAEPGAAPHAAAHPATAHSACRHAAVSAADSSLTRGGGRVCRAARAARHAEPAARAFAVARGCAQARSCGQARSRRHGAPRGRRAACRIAGGARSGRSVQRGCAVGAAGRPESSVRRPRSRHAELACAQSSDCRCCQDASRCCARGGGG